jgi:tetrahydromethanopterin S-methyltransferase subunit G
MQLELFTTLNNEFVYLNQTIIDTDEYDEMCEYQENLYEEVENANEEIEYYRELNGDK